MASLSGRDILIIDDADETRVLARKILEVDGATVSDAASIDAGIEIAKKQIPHLILLDLELVGKSGFDFLDFRTKDPLLKDVPTVVLSAKKDRASVQKAILLGANNYIVKPFRATLLLQKVRKELKLNSFHTKKVPPGEAAAATLSLTGEIVTMNEVGCMIESSVKFSAEEDIRLKSEFLNEVGAEEVRTRTTKRPPRILEASQYECEVSFIGLDRDLANKLRVKLKGGS